MSRRAPAGARFHRRPGLLARGGQRGAGAGAVTGLHVRADRERPAPEHGSGADVIASNG